MRHFVRRLLVLVLLLMLIGACGLLWLPNRFSPLASSGNRKLTTARGTRLALTGPRLAIQRYGSDCRLEQVAYVVIVTNGNVFFPTLGISQRFSITSTLVADRTEQEVQFAGPGPIPAGVYRYENIICDLG